MIKKERKHQISENAVLCQTEFNFTSRVGTKLRRELKMFFKMLRLQDLSLTLVIYTDTNANASSENPAKNKQRLMERPLFFHLRDLHKTIPPGSQLGNIVKSLGIPN